MIRLCHVIGPSAAWDDQLACLQCLRSWTDGDVAPTLAAQSPAATGPVAKGGAFEHRRTTIPQSVPRIPLWSGPAWLAAQAGRLALGSRAFDVVIAWGMQAACMARPMFPKTPLLIGLHDPNVKDSALKWLRQFEPRPSWGIACGSDLLRRRLVEGGVPLGACSVIRPGVDFTRLNQFRRTQAQTRRQLGVEPQDRLILLPPMDGHPAHVASFYGARIAARLYGRMRVLLCGDTPTSRNLMDLDHHLPQDEAPSLLLPAPAFPVEAAISLADVLVVSDPRDISTTMLAWAMAARTAILSPATHAVTELIAHKVNGLLYNPRQYGNASPAVAALLRDTGALHQAKEAAHGQAFDVFRLQRHLEQLRQAVENLLNGRAVGHAISDAALVS